MITAAPLIQLLEDAVSRENLVILPRGCLSIFIRCFQPFSFHCDVSKRQNATVVFGNQFCIVTLSSLCSCQPVLLLLILVKFSVNMC